MTRRKKPPYYVVRNGRAYFELGRDRAAKAGMSASEPLGRASLSAEKAASELYYKWRQAVGAVEVIEETPNYKRGTVGHWYYKYREKELWRRKKPETVKEWEYYWPFIDAEFGETRIDRVTPTMFERFHIRIEAEHGADARWRIVKLARALFNAAKKFHIIERSPCYPLPNSRPAPRSQHWLAREVAQLIEAAERVKPAMALSIRIAWETLLSPIDVRLLKVSSLKTDGKGYYIETRRSKTGKVVFAAISNDLGRDILEYIENLPVELLPSEPILRTARDHKRYTKARFSFDFALVRKAAFGPDEARWMMDLRRSGNLEADLGDASPEDRAEILANSLHMSKDLEDTYTPMTVAKARQIAKKRAIGRGVLEAASLKDTG